MGTKFVSFKQKIIRENSDHTQKDNTLNKMQKIPNKFTKKKLNFEDKYYFSNDFNVI